MKGCVYMANLNQQQQFEIACKIMKDELAALKKLPPKEAQKKARKSLMNAGIVDADGNYTKPYIALGRSHAL